MLKETKDIYDKANEMMDDDSFVDKIEDTILIFIQEFISFPINLVKCLLVYMCAKPKIKTKIKNDTILISIVMFIIFTVLSFIQKNVIYVIGCLIGIFIVLYMQGETNNGKR